jgi:hypothetical protein
MTRRNVLASAFDGAMRAAPRPEAKAPVGVAERA